MTPPPQKSCPVPDCQYSTPEGLPTYDILYRDLELHAKYNHENQQPGPVQGGGTGGGGEGSRADKLPRPALREEATEADFIYFSDSWKRYKRSTGLTGQAAIDQLWACCSPELSRSVYDSGVTSEDSESKLLEVMKRMAVRAQNSIPLLMW